MAQRAADMTEEPAKPKRTRKPKVDPILASVPEPEVETEETVGSGRGRPKGPMTDEHKAALADGREAGRAIRAYLDAMEAHQPKRGRRRSRDTVERRLAAIEVEIGSCDSLTRLHLAQERITLSQELSVFDDTPDLSVVEDAFVLYAAAYSQRKGVSYEAWREVGVPSHLLRAAGISR